jgi:hypothetical protein
VLRSIQHDNRDSQLKCCPNHCNSHNIVSAYYGARTCERADLPSPILIVLAGYNYSVPFLAEGIVDTSQSHVKPLYQHLITAEYGETLSFIGLPFQVVPFPQFELQCKYVARMLSGRAPVPSVEEMETWIHSHYKSAEESGLLDRHIHKQRGAQWDYNDWLAEQCGDDVDSTTSWRRELWKIVEDLKRTYDNSAYRDKLDDQAATEVAQAALVHRFKSLSKEEQVPRDCGVGHR